MKAGLIPVGRLSARQVRSVLLAATTPPPLHDTRPWRFLCTPGSIELHAGPPAGGRRGQLLDCGAALLNLRLAVKAQGCHPDVRLLPAATQPDLLAVVRPRGLEPVTPVDRRLIEAIRLRRGNRSPFSAALVPPAVQRELRKAAELERAWLATIGDAQLPQLCEIMLPGGAACTDFAAAPGRLLVAVGSLHDTPLAQLQAGQAVQRVLLTAAAAGLSAAHWSDTLTPARRRDLRRLLGGGMWPQAVLRLGHGAPVPLRPHIGLDAVVTSDERPFSRGWP
ncbi:MULTISPECIES: hypothetical protein [unclassified Amycolatopsis]|uniref:hypothetical protein n=1 Tax=unclassified Amycolatopsis TaxID=2618356 RepID=UPI001C696AB7|nr:hypothetical protein [Amycolatopsis sp. DSM 110486]QYN20518.1 hypothetical protein K1T34_49935 [Amycolatopsis sp. DSM 110486]